MSASFDLLDEEWIPVRTSTRTRKVGLRELFLRAHELADVEVALPPAASGFWRILYVLTGRVTGLDDPDLVGFEWYAQRNAVLREGAFDPDAVNHYFDRYAARFRLFDPDRPWLQDPRLAAECGKSSGINKLVLGRPAGNSQVWFSHHSDLDPQPIPAGDAVWYLIAQLFYGPSGRCTSRTVRGRTEANSTAGPLRGTVSFHPIGSSMFESLLAGLPAPREIEGEATGPAPWELDELPDPLGVPGMVEGVAALVGRFRHAVLLKPDPAGREVVDAWMTWGWREAHGPTEDPYLIYQTSKQGSLYARAADCERAVFRDLDALLCKNSGDPGVKRPSIMDSVQKLRPDVLAGLRLRAYGFDQDGQTRDRQWFIATTPPVLGFIEEERDDAAARFSQWRHGAEKAGRNLQWALRQVWVAVNDPSNGDGRQNRKDLGDGPWSRRATASYWPVAEREFWQRVRARDFDADDAVFFRAAMNTFDEVTSPYKSRPRWARAIERHRGLIFAGRRTPTDAQAEPSR